MTASMGGRTSDTLIERFADDGTYQILDGRDPLVPVALDPPARGLRIEPGSGLLPSDLAASMGYQLQLSGNVAPGDTFSVGAVPAGSYDNGNGVLMLNREDRSLQSLGALGQAVAVATSAARYSAEAAESILQGSVAARDRISGVNLDEEAADLLRFEQAYNASAQVISVARSLFDSLIASLGR